MRYSSSDPNPHHKQQIRSEINSQIQRFLQEGGKIEVCNRGPHQDSGKLRAPAWIQQQDLQGIVE